MNYLKISIVFVLCFILIPLDCQSTDLRRSLTHASDFQDSAQAPIAQLPVIDIHNHLHGGRRQGDLMNAAISAIEKMDALGISKMVIMPPPGSPGHPGVVDMAKLLPVIRQYPGRFACLGGGGSLNVMIHQAKNPESVNSALIKKFKAKALKILEDGAIGFGELAAEHFSFSRSHPYESISPDHPLFLVLADIAADHDVPIDIHMEAISKEIKFPSSRFLDRSKRNPAKLSENLSAFKRFVSHNQNAKIIWAHAGWCNTGLRTVDLCRQLFEQHHNLYMSFKLAPEGKAFIQPLSSNRKQIKPEWLQLIRDFPDRFLIGTDQFYTIAGGRRIGPQKTETMIQFINLLPLKLARQVCIENPNRIFKF
ncbi:MAG: hypothetical protein GY699_15945 [Desulfobacteraceae bacterium]|nr:hypothetical protein [Desulfobacteraceae bacterium]